MLSRNFLHYTLTSRYRISKMYILSDVLLVDWVIFDVKIRPVTLQISQRLMI